MCYGIGLSAICLKKKIDVVLPIEIEYQLFALPAFTPAQTIRAGGLLLEEPNQALSSLSFGYKLKLVKSKA